MAALPSRCTPKAEDPKPAGGPTRRPPWKASNQLTFLGDRLKRLSRTRSSLIVSIGDAFMATPFDDQLDPAAAGAQNMLVEARARCRQKQQRQGGQCHIDGGRTEALWGRDNAGPYRRG